MKPCPGTTLKNSLSLVVILLDKFAVLQWHVVVIWRYGANVDRITHGHSHMQQVQTQERKQTRKYIYMDTCIGSHKYMHIHICVCMCVRTLFHEFAKK